nr:hypothetical protein [Tanacetum cinerariifolium]
EEEEKEESKKNVSNEASEIGSNFESSGYAASDNEVESDLESTARIEPKCKEMEDTCESGVQPKPDSSYLFLLMLSDYPSRGVIALTRWIEKIESVIDNSTCVENQKVNYAASSFINKALTWWNTQVQERGRETIVGMTWVEFKALLVEEFCPNNKKAKVGKRFVATTPPRNENVGSYPKCAKCSAYHPEGGPCRLCFNCQKPGHFARDCQVPVKQVAPISDVRMGNNQRVCYECGSSKHLCNTCPKLNRAPGQATNRLALEGNRNTRNIGKRARGRAFSVNAVDVLQDPNVVTCTFSLNDHFANVLFDSGADFSFISTKFAPLLNEKPSINKAEIVCHEKVVRIPLEGGEILCVQRKRTLGATKTLMSTKADEPELSDIPIVLDFTDVFPKDLSRLPPQRQVEFRMDLIPRATSVTKSPYRLAPLEMQELSEQLQELQDKGFIRPNKFVIVFIDDILIYSKTKKDHEVYLKLVLELLKKERLYAKFSKCEFWLKKVHFLVHAVNHNGIHVDPSKIEAVKNWKAPAAPSKIRSFFRLAGYYRRFIMNFSKIDKPLTSLTRKNKKYKWGVDQEEAFETLKDNLCNFLILSLPDGIEDFVVYCDASNQRLGCVLMQRGKVITYAS